MISLELKPTRDQREQAHINAQRWLEIMQAPGKPHPMAPPDVGPKDLKEAILREAEARQAVLDWSPIIHDDDVRLIQREQHRLGQAISDACSEFDRTYYERGFVPVALVKPWLDAVTALHQLRTTTKMILRDAGQNPIPPCYLFPWGASIVATTPRELAGNLGRHIETFGSCRAKRVFGPDGEPIRQASQFGPGVPAAEPMPAPEGGLDALIAAGSHALMTAERPLKRKQP